MKNKETNQPTITTTSNPPFVNPFYYDDVVDMAVLQHEIWSHWMKYQYSVCEEADDGALVIPAEKVKRWKTQMNTLYKDLSASEQLSDINIVMDFIVKSNAKLDFGEVRKAIGHEVK